MLLAIDIGNTNTVFAVYDEETLCGCWRMQTVAARTADEYAAFLSAMLAEMAIERRRISGMIVCSVVPDADFNIRALGRDYLGKDPMFITAANAGIKVKLDRPEEAGADRLVNAVAVKIHYKTPAIVIDFGTATTFDVIDARGSYIGGAIAPGINLSLEALRRAAARLPRISVKKPDQVIAKTTVSAMQSGIYWGYIGLIEGMVQKISREMNAKPYVLATGGLAPLFATGTKIIKTVDNDLTLKGLLNIYRRNHAQKK